MKISLFLLFLLAFTVNLDAQRRRMPTKIKRPVPVVETTRDDANNAVVVDERLAVLRSEPGFAARTIVRMRRGRQLTVSVSREADGATFYRVNALPNNFGWVQAEAVVKKSKIGDDVRLANLVQTSDGFERIERAQIFLDVFDKSALRPAILLLLGDLMEETALKISADATKKLDRREMAASGAPLHSFYLSYVSLDRYRRLGLNFVFNPATKLLHYDGSNWNEIIRKFPKSPEAAEAQKRLDALAVKMELKKN